MIQKTRTDTKDHRIEHYLEIANELRPRVEAAADRIDADRQLPADLAGEMAQRGLFRLLVPRELGGAELDHPDFLRILRVFAAVDASTAWCINQNNVFSTASSIMDKRAAHEVWDAPEAVVTNGPPSSSARAVPVEGGYRLSGRWDFSSGIDHATWVAALAPLENPAPSPSAGRHGRGGPGPRTEAPTPGAARNPDSARLMLIPRQDVRMVDTWQASGLRGTGSFSFEVDDLFIPAYRTYAQTDPSWHDGPLYLIPRSLLFAAGFSTVALGVAQGSLKTTIDLAGRKTPGRSRNLLQDMATTHRMIGQSEAIWHSARAFLSDSVSAVWDSACKNHSLDDGERIRLRLSTTHAIRMSAEVVDICYNLCGSSAIFASNPIQRRFQDIHVITQHAQGRMTHYETAGQYFLGLEPEGMF